MLTKKISLHHDYDTIESAIQYIDQNYTIQSIYLVGISMGSFMSTKYLGGNNVHNKIKGVICFDHYFNLRNHTESLLNFSFMHWYGLKGCQQLLKQVQIELHLLEDKKTTKNIRPSNNRICTSLS